VSGRRIVLASGNAHKAVELARVLPGWDVQAYAGELPEETGDTFAANALLKARHVFAATGGRDWVLADDSGIEAAALGGIPGVRSARYAGEDATDEENLAKLLEALRDVEPERRTARYRCVAALAWPDGREVWAEGTCEGVIVLERRGDGGFGYDPSFVPDGGTETMAELTDEEKDAISHRGRAFRSLRARLAPT